MRIQHILWLFCHYIPSLFFCLRYLPFKQALKVPILLGERIKIGNLKRGDIIINNPRRAQITIGFRGTEGRSNRRTMLSVRNGGKIIFRGSAILSNGTCFIADKGTIDIGNGFFCNSGCWLFSDTNIIFGKGCMLGWDIEINTTDGHYMVYGGKRQPLMSASITIGNKVWICSFVTIGKGVTIGEDSVIAQHALVNRSFPNGKQLIGGLPSKVLKEDVSWEKK